MSHYCFPLVMKQYSHESWHEHRCGSITEPKPLTLRKSRRYPRKGFLLYFCSILDRSALRCACKTPGAVHAVLTVGRTLPVRIIFGVSMKSTQEEDRCFASCSRELARESKDVNVEDCKTRGRWIIMNDWTTESVQAAVAPAPGFQAGADTCFCQRHALK